MTKLHDWLKELGLEQYASVLSKNDIDLDILPDFTESDLVLSGWARAVGHAPQLAEAKRLLSK